MKWGILIWLTLVKGEIKRSLIKWRVGKIQCTNVYLLPFNDKFLEVWNGSNDFVDDDLRPIL
jgi:hypothetical protein